MSPVNKKSTTSEKKTSTRSSSAGSTTKKSTPQDAPAQPEAAKAAKAKAPAKSKKSLLSADGALMHRPSFDQQRGESPVLTDFDIHLFREGKHNRLYEKMGAHLMEQNGVQGTYFAVWAPNAHLVSVVGDFNGWMPGAIPLTLRGDGSGIWDGFVPGLGKGTIYKYHMESKYHAYRADKGDPYAFYWQNPPNNASIVWDLHYDWNDTAWMERRSEHNALDKPYAVYELHLGSWRRVPEEDNRFLTYRELAHQLADYLSDLGYTHVELMPVMEHPFYPSWGYQVHGYFAPTSRYGTPQDFMYMVDYLHQHNIGVILDWVPSHFPTDEHGLGFFDGTHLYEHADPRQGYHPDWKSSIFNYSRNEVREFLLSSAMIWLDKYHIDGLRVDAVASMLYLDYSRKNGEWIPNNEGGRENSDAISFLREFNETVYTHFPGVQTIAEESTAWSQVSRPTYVGGLGFGMKWNMGWMHDSLKYFSTDPIYRLHHHDQITFSMLYAFNENFMLPFSHDEVVHMKGSMLNKMPGDDWQRFANLRLLLGYQYAHPGKKLLFMGAEFGQWSEWAHERSLDWHLLEHQSHQGIQNWVRDCNHAYRAEPALYERDFDWWGFEWISCHDRAQSVLAFIRRGNAENQVVLAVCNFTPVPRHNYRVGVPVDGEWEEILNSDASNYGGSGMGNMGKVDAQHVSFHNQHFSVELTLPPLSIVLLRPKVH